MHRVARPSAVGAAANFVKGAFGSLKPMAPQPRQQMLYDFSQPRDRAEWSVTSDAAFGGFSRANLDATTDSSAIRFDGVLSQAKPQGSKLVRSGFAAIRSKRYPRTPLAPYTMNLEAFDTVELILRGDGRTYISNLSTDSVQEHDVYQSFVYTRGGPEWERILLPFARYLLTYHGYVQEDQPVFNKRAIRTFGFSLADGVEGPFALEIKSIRVLNTDNDDVAPDNYPDSTPTDNSAAPPAKTRPTPDDHPRSA
ncbi:hypothetical protein CAOG_03583 [Capsaspora owczarzaki ATCC 30864]|uniref:NADH:ubiquinone oxidoreductase intermediate-associated protein 30 domain-containing protein n=1 Tax=Capsaspora owczarzaki (strain ATCC 30864) TaxID=595528 RepID=A0A0D2UCD6_CAPO3|nr:hypothetical protein CAOG_03583 [Capsaspora owczarzaki ATCC 30864]KJE92666.1 hypothetical protein CAOG_003583 [Capsaspora owczarzaki ATCC 30864]|eukprot:XP_004363311.1 hypothetical protein CAOG_03583 [Capsaspora owczarzaki ATCC 30864]